MQVLCCLRVTYCQLIVWGGEAAPVTGHTDHILENFVTKEKVEISEECRDKALAAELRTT